METEIQAQIIEYLRKTALGSSIIRLERRNGGVIRKTNGDFSAFAYRVYLPGIGGITAGMPDIEGILSDGRWFGIEIKREKGKLSAKQQVFAVHAKMNNLPYLVAYSVNDVIEWLQNIQATQEDIK